jgi:predicted acylesterase/phospholipase RssA
VGALRWLVREKGLTFDIFAGTSTGSLIVPLFAAQGAASIDELVRQYTTVKTRDILRPRLVWDWLKPESIYKTDPLRERVDRTMTAEVFAELGKKGKQGQQVFLTTVDLRSGYVVYFQTGALLLGPDGKPFAEPDLTVAPIRDRKELVNAMVASSSMPVFMPPVRAALGGLPAAPYVDGGVREYAPIKVAIEAGADEVVCMVLQPDPKAQPQAEGSLGDAIGILRVTIDLLSVEVGESDVRLSRLYTDALRYREALAAQLLAKGVPQAVLDAATAEAARQHPDPMRGRREVKLHVIRPMRQLAGETLKCDPKEMTDNLEYGEEMAKAQYRG